MPQLLGHLPVADPRRNHAERFGHHHARHLADCIERALQFGPAKDHAGIVPFGPEESDVDHVGDRPEGPKRCHQDRHGHGDAQHAGGGPERPAEQVPRDHDPGLAQQASN